MNVNIEKDGIKNSTTTSFFTNHGFIDINYSKYGIRNTGTFINEGELYTRNIGFTHITNQGEEAQLTNNGRLVTRANFGFGTRINNSNGATFENNGYLHVRDNFGFGGISNQLNSTFINSDSINCSRGIVNKGTFFNDQGIIALDSLQLINDGEFAEFTNNGALLISKYFANLENKNGASFTNEGKLTISDIPLGGFGVIRNKNPNTSFINTGSIEIMDTGFDSAPSDGLSLIHI